VARRTNPRAQRHKRGQAESAPKFARRKVVEPDPRFLTRKEWLKLRNELPDHVRTMADFAIATGLRWGNVSRLTWDRVDLRNRQIWIAGSQAKSRKPMGIPLSAAAIAALRRVPGKREGSFGAESPLKARKDPGAPPGPVLAWKDSGFTICVICGPAGTLRPERRSMCSRSSVAGRRARWWNAMRTCRLRMSRASRIMRESPARGMRHSGHK
jgi:integrase